MTVALHVETAPEGEATIVRPVGDLALETYPLLRDTLLRCAIAEPAAIVVDVDAMSAESPALAVFITVWIRLNDWPGVPLLLVATREPLRTALDNSAVPRFVPTYRTLAAALDDLRAMPLRQRRQVSLAGGPTNAWHARRLVAHTCVEWEIAAVATDAVLVASELAENAYRHAGSAGWIRLGLRRRLLTVAVADTDPRLPRQRPADDRVGGGQGLVIVDELSRAWGYEARPDGGKVVWATLTVPGA